MSMSWRFSDLITSNCFSVRSSFSRIWLCSDDQVRDNRAKDTVSLNVCSGKWLEVAGDIRNWAPDKGPFQYYVIFVPTYLPPANDDAMMTLRGGVPTYLPSRSPKIILRNIGMVPNIIHRTNSSSFPSWAFTYQLCGL